MKRLFCNEIDEDFEESDFIYEPESSRKDSAGCLTGIKRVKSLEALEITESRVNALYQVIEYLGLGRNVTESHRGSTPQRPKRNVQDLPDN